MSGMTEGQAIAHVRHMLDAVEALLPTLPTYELRLERLGSTALDARLKAILSRVTGENRECGLESGEFFNLMYYAHRYSVIVLQSELLGNALPVPDPAWLAGWDDEAVPRPPSEYPDAASGL